MKTCPNCGNTKTKAEFYTDKKTSDSLSWDCKQCAMMRSKKARDAHAPEYKVWYGMRDRCRREGSKHFKHYGGRGISVCKEWDSFEQFVQDVGARPSMQHQLDRIDNDGNYEPGNCRWVLPATNVRNSRLAKLDTVQVKLIKAMISNGVPQKNIAKIFNVSPSAISRIKCGNRWGDVKPRATV